MENSWSEKRLQLKEKFIDAIADTMDLYGIVPSVAKLYGIMFFEDEPMTLEKMKDVMGMSKSNMSYAVRALVDSKMVVKLDNKKERKDLYQAESNFYTAFQNFFATKLQREMDVMVNAIGEVTPELKELILHIDTPDDVRKQALKDLHKLVHATEYYAWLQTFIEQINEGEIFRKKADGDRDADATNGGK
ncbi:HTH-type transcriptional repressor GbsR [Paenibacillus tyrfis]|uniref:GbsR/MarR family transcriptional regulator n=1 Tax=Paenibacillus tyrfis TaxID=1501230 RepID=UPI002493C8FF|nr:transcriptional regulator [Paenibacillus tyrfis]GLI06840.1 HTH-type transcriptional repressor GbsR [Paenibacillus tyrfis]